MLILILANGSRIETPEVLADAELLGGMIIGYIIKTETFGAKPY